jgi:pimeloyl-ACP methyl ester carboxylesterase
VRELCRQLCGLAWIAILAFAAYTVLPAGVATAVEATNRSSAEQANGMYADLPGVNLWFIDTGGAGTPIVLLHSNTGNSEIWQPQIEKFSRAGYRVIAFDRRGWGKSTAVASSGEQPGSIAGDLAALADHLKLDKFHLLGVAGGGFAALDYAAWHPERLRSLVVGGSTGEIKDKEIADFAARIEIPELRKQPAVYLEVAPSYRGANLEGTARWMDINQRARQSGAPSQPLRTPNTFAKIETIPTPTLVVAADADLLAPPAMMRIWAEHVKKHEWATMQDAGHAMAWEQPDTFNKIVLDFIGRH